MYLKGIEIKGFKSFLDKTAISFPRGMISIVGPNGSGKSNILDAIRWVLGEQSIKSLRGDKLEDVIFSGTQTRNALGYCEVTLIIDNEDKKVNIDYTELSIKRKVYRSGESQFYINNKRCRLKDIKEILLDTGIGKEGYSIISQGRIDEIINSNTNQKRALLEEASGITKYRYKKEEGEKNLLTAKENLERIEDIYIEIENQIKPLKTQKEKAERYLSYKQELQAQEINKIIKTQEEIEEEKKNIDLKKQELQKIIDEKMKQIEQSDEIIIKVQQDYDFIQEKKTSLYSQKNDKNEDLNHNKTEISIKSEAIKNLEQTNTILNEQLAESSTQMDSIVKKYETLSKEKEDINLQKTDIQSKLSSYNKMQDEYKEQLNNLNMTIKSSEQKSRDIENEIAKLETRMDFLKTNIDSFTKKFEEYDEVQKTYENKIDEIKKNIEQKNTQISSVEKEIAKTKQYISSNEEKLAGLNQKNIDINKNINELNLNFKDLSAKTQMLENFENDMQGFSKGIKHILKNKELEGIQNVVANVIKVKKGYEKAIEQLLSGRLENIIIDKSYQSKKAIEYLKKSNLGRATFLPLDTIQPSYMNYSDEGVKAIDVVEYDKKYENIISNLLGKMVIVEDMDTALKISAKYKNSFRMSTKTGEVFNIGGSITGGSSNFSKEIFTRRNTIAENKERLKQIEDEISTFQEKSAFIAKDIQNLRKENENNQFYLDEKQKKSYKLESEKVNLNTKLENQEQLLLQLDEERKSVQYSHNQSVKSYENDKISLYDLKKDYEDKNTDIKEKTAILEEKNRSLSQLQTSIKDLDLKNQLIIQNLENIQTTMQDLSQSINFNNKKSESSQNKIKSNELQISNLQKELYDLDKKNKDIVIKLEDLSKKIEKTSQEEKELNERLKLLTKQKEELSKENNITLTDKLKIEGEESKINYKLQILEENLMQTYSMTLQEAKSYKDESIVVSNTLIKKLKEQISLLGNINLDSIEEFNKINERYLFYKNQKEDLKSSISKINQVIKQLEKSMIEDFKLNFDIINKNFNDIFKILFGGGSGRLILEDENDILNSNIDISVQPPGKKLRAISMLSGGEKALSAIALLFAIIARKPVPFCILDEIDAPLDDANIYRYIQYLSTLAGTTQFITITHRRGTMEASDYIYGITMQEKGVSNIVSLKLEDAKNYIEE